MFGRTVSINGVEVFVPCVPTTPYSEICLRAAKIFKIEEENEAKAKGAALADARSRELAARSPQEKA